jgi:hypothetical protein
VQHCIQTPRTTGDEISQLVIPLTCKHEEASTQRGVQHCIQTPRTTGDEISHSIDMQVAVREQTSLVHKRIAVYLYLIFVVQIEQLSQHSACLRFTRFTRSTRQHEGVRQICSCPRAKDGRANEREV